MDANDNPIENVKVGWAPNIALLICITGIIVTGLMSGGYNYIYSLLK
jgi:NADH-quinone oxidoreductase subunit N